MTARWGALRPSNARRMADRSGKRPGGAIDEVATGYLDLPDGGWPDEPTEPGEAGTSLPRCLSHHDPIQPRAEPVVCADGAPRSPGSLERHLDDVLRRRHIPAHQAGQPEESFVVDGHERFHGQRLTRGRG